MATYVLVHGAWHTGAELEPTAAPIRAAGHDVHTPTIAGNRPGDAKTVGLSEAIKSIVDYLAQKNLKDVVLVGHSYGGSVITEAGNDPNVAALVYIAAFALDEGESCASIETAVPQASKAFKPDSDGNWWIEQDHFAADFAADIPAEQAAFMAIAQVPISTDAFTHKVSNPAWKNKPTWYMVAGSDLSINPIQERMMAKRANATTVEVNSSHVAYMSHPKEAAKLIEDAATHAHVN